MRDHGAAVVAVDTPDRASLRADLGVPEDLASCHTAEVGGYAIEGHVPAPAIDRLLATRPDAVGLAVPGMPPLSPGMGGEPSDWAQIEVTLIAPDGGLSVFEWSYEPGAAP